MKVFTDIHHYGLYASLKMLFEDRFGWELYRPIGTEWASSGWWKVAEPYGNAPDTVDQYLGIHAGFDRFKNLNGDYRLKDNIYFIKDHENNIEQKAITLKTFQEMKFDLILGTHPLHDSWQGLLQFQPKAKFVMQLGNFGQTTRAKHVMSSVYSYVPEEGQHVIFYHQEADLREFYTTQLLKSKQINSFVFLLPFAELYDFYKMNLPEFEFKAYGMGARDGILNTQKELGQKMRDSLFGWHVKPADGYGHLIHQWFSCGRPIITRGKFYQGQTGGLLLEDGITCIDLDKHSFQENLALIRELSDPELHQQMCECVRERFTQVVDYDSEEDALRKFFAEII